MLKTDSMKHVALKIISLISELKQCSENLSSKFDNNYQITNYFNASLEKTLEKIFEAKNSIEFNLYIVENVEGCYPVLREKWKFLYNPVKLNGETSEKTYSQACLFLRSIAIFSAMLPKYINARIELEVVGTNNKNTYNWDSFMQKTNLKYFPVIPINFKNDSGNLLVQNEYSVSDIKPKIKEKDLGIRPRLVSYEIDDFHEIQKANLSLISDSSPQDNRRKSRLLSLITSENILTDSEVGFNVLVGDIDNDTGDDDFGHNSFDIEVNNEYDTEYNEDSSVTLYIQMCNNVKNLRLF